MTLDQEIQLGNAIGTWIAGIATFLAVLVSLHLARRSEKIQLEARAGYRHMVAGDGTPAQPIVSITVVNQGARPVTIDNIGWVLGKGKKRHYMIQSLTGPSKIPIELAHGHRAQYLIPLSAATRWFTDFYKYEEAKKNDRFLDSLVLQIYTTVGVVYSVKAEQGLIDKIKAARPNP